jgi:4-amino-4-deoxy-L-arabinose transferase-like glycosyltransferase
VRGRTAGRGNGYGWSFPGTLGVEKERRAAPGTDHEPGRKAGAATSARPAADPSPAPRPARVSWPLLTVLVVAALGIALRVWILGRSAVSSDEAVVGHMADQILRGHFFAFYWGQYYGGGEPYVVAALFALFGRSRFVLGLALVLLDAAAALLVWRLGRRLFGARVGVLAALVFWIWPEVYVYQSTVEYGFRYLTLVCGLGVLLFVLRVSDPPRARTLDAAALGLLAGVGWWCSPEIVYFLLPALLLLGYRLARRRTRLTPAAVAAAAGAALIGALPWLAVNVPGGFVSLHPVPYPVATTWAGRLGTFFARDLPLVMGVSLRGSGTWVLPSWLGPAALALVALALAAWTAVLALRRRALLLVAFVAVFPFVFAAPATSHYWADGRYALYLAPAVALLVASAAEALAAAAARTAAARGWRPEARRRLRAAVLVLPAAAALALTAAAVPRLAPYAPLAVPGSPRPTWTAWRAEPGVWQARTVASLERADVHTAFASYWAAYALTFAAHGGVVFSDPFDWRYRPYLEAVLRSPRSAWLFPRASTLALLQEMAGQHSWLVGSVTQAQLESYLHARGIGFDSWQTGYFTVVRPWRAVDPYAVAAAPVAQRGGRGRGARGS